MDHQILEVPNAKPIKLWTQGVPVEEDARRQLINTARMPFIFGSSGFRVGQGSRV